jgi:hypothetical protein
MIYVIDLSAPRKYLIEKYDDIMLEYKLHPKKINKYLVCGMVAGAILLIGTNAYAMGISSQDYNDMLNYLVQRKHYPRSYAENIMKSFTESDMETLKHTIHVSQGGQGLGDIW